MGLESNSLVPILIIVLGLLSLSFVIRFLLPAVFLRQKLATLSKNLRSIKEPTIAILDKTFSRLGDLEALWTEYRATLHHQTKLFTSSGQYETVDIRSTVPAEYVFTSEAVFENRIGSEFFKHLPGVLTGIGIIGTFWGLINGLAAFEISQNPSAVAESLNHLMGAVHQAFFVSAIAIGCAVGMTFLEKFFIATLTFQLSTIQLTIDAFFRAGTGEEYLGRIARSSESAEKEARILKDALVSELAVILDQVTTRQIVESGAQTRSMRQELIDGLNESLSAPIAAIAEVAQRLGGSQVDAVNSLLTDTLTQFSAQLRDMFTDQMSGSTEMQQQATLALQKILTDVGTMAERLSHASENASFSISQQVSEALSAMEQRQRGMTDAFREALDSMRSDVAMHADSSNARVVATVDALGAQVASLVVTLQNQVASVSAKDEARLEALSQHFASIQADVAAIADSSNARVIATVDALGTKVASLIDTLQNQVASASAKDETRLQALTEHYATIHGSVAASADSSNAKVVATVDALGAQVASLINTLQNQVANASAKDEVRLRTLTDHYAAVQTGVAASAETSNAKVIATVDALEAQVASLINALQNQVANASAKDEVRLQALTNHYDAVQTGVAASADASNAKVVATVDALGSQVASLIGALQNQVATTSAKEEARLESLGRHYAAVQTDIVASADASNAKIVATVNGLGREVATLMSTLQHQVTNMSARDDARLEALTKQYASIQSEMGSAMRSTFEQMAGMREQLRGTIDALKSITGGTFDKLIVAANAVEASALKFADAGSKTADVLSRSNQLVSELGQVSRALAGVGDTISSVMAEYKSVREDISQLVGELAGLLDSAKREAGLTESIVAKLDAASAKLGVAAREADEYLAQVSQVLGSTFSEFSTQVELSLRRGNSEFQQELTSATRLLKQQIADFGEVLETMPVLKSA